VPAEPTTPRPTKRCLCLSTRLRGDARMAHMLFDVSGVVGLGDWQSKAGHVAQRSRQLGVGRVLYGSDGAAGGNLKPREAWAAFRSLPLSDAEFATIELNVAPYIRYRAPSPSASRPVAVTRIASRQPALADVSTPPRPTRSGTSRVVALTPQFGLLALLLADLAAVFPPFAALGDDAVTRGVSTFLRRVSHGVPPLRRILHPRRIVSLGTPAPQRFRVHTRVQGAECSVQGAYERSPTKKRANVWAAELLLVPSLSLPNRVVPTCICRRRVSV
jgi:hypothetical protein